MSDPVDPTRRAKRFLSAEQKYEVFWLRILTGELTTNEAAARAGVDRSTVWKLRKVAKDDGELVALRAENARLSATVVEQAIELAALRGKAPWG